MPTILPTEVQFVCALFGVPHIKPILNSKYVLTSGMHLCANQYCSKIVWTIASYFCLFPYKSKIGLVRICRGSLHRREQSKSEVETHKTPNHTCGMWVDIKYHIRYSIILLLHVHVSTVSCPDPTHLTLELGLGKKLMSLHIRTPVMSYVTVTSMLTQQTVRASRI